LAKKLRAALASRGRLTPTPPRRLGAPRKTAEQAAPDRPAHNAVFALRALSTPIKACLWHAAALAARR